MGDVSAVFCEASGLDDVFLHRAFGRFQFRLSHGADLPSALLRSCCQDLSLPVFGLQVLLPSREGGVFSDQERNVCKKRHIGPKQVHLR